MRTRRLSGSKRSSSEISTNSVRAAVAAHSKASRLEESSSKKSVRSSCTSANVFQSHTKKLDSGELAELWHAFNAFDLDQSGTIDSGEISKALARLGMSVSDSKARAMLREADANRSGSIDFDEFVPSESRTRGLLTRR